MLPNITVPAETPELMQARALAARAETIRDASHNLVRMVALTRKTTAQAYYGDGIATANALLHAAADGGVGVVNTDLELRLLAQKLIGSDADHLTADEIQWATGSPLEPFGLDGKFYNAQDVECSPDVAVKFTVFVKP